MMTNKKILLIASSLGALIIAGCAGQRVEMSFDDAHKQFNKQVFGAALDANAMVSAMEYVSGYETWDLSAAAQGLHVDAELDLDYEGKQDAMSFEVGLKATGADTNEGLEFDVSVDGLLKMIAGETYFYINEATIADEKQESPMMQLVQAFADQLSKAWIHADSPATGDVALSTQMSSLQLAQDTLGSDGLQKARQFFGDVQKLLNDNLLFIQKGEAIESKGKVAYPLALNIGGITTILEGIVYHEYADMFLSQNGQPLTQEEKQSLVKDIPEMLATLTLNAHLRVDALNSVALVIDQMAFPAPDGTVAGGIVKTEISNKKVNLAVESESGATMLTVKNQGKALAITVFNDLGKAATVVLRGAIDAVTGSVLYNLGVDVDADLAKFAPDMYQDETLDLTLEIEKLIESTGAVDVTVPADVTSLQMILEAMGLSTPQPDEIDMGFGDLGSANPYNIPSDDSFGRNEMLMGE